MTYRWEKAGNWNNGLSEQCHGSRALVKPGASETIDVIFSHFQGQLCVHNSMQSQQPPLVQGYGQQNNYDLANSISQTVYYNVVILHSLLSQLS